MTKAVQGHLKEGAEPTEPGHDAWDARSLRQWLDALHERMAGIDVDAGAEVIEPARFGRCHVICLLGSSAWSLTNGLHPRTPSRRLLGLRGGEEYAHQLTN